MPTADSANETAPPISHDEIRAELACVLASLSFKSSPRCQDFLRHVVEQTLAGTHHELKERTIGVELFGRPPTYDTSSDGIVRIRASEVRKRLALYYADGGKKAKLQIALPLGSYLPTISRFGGRPNGTSHGHDASETVEPQFNLTEKGAHHKPLARPLLTPKVWVASSLLLLTVILAGAGWIHFGESRTVSHRFWQPFMGSSEPVLIVTSYTPVYLPPIAPVDANAPYRLMTDRYVGGGDLVGAVLVTSMLTSSHHPYNHKMNTAITLNDLRGKPTVLIGYASTQWSDITKTFRFFVQRGMVTDHGQDTDWRPHRQADGRHVDDDYAIVSRAFDPETNSMIILVSGCTGYGTEEAARLVTDSKLLDVALKNAPKNWQDKNLQLVLHVEVVANAPANAQVVSSYYW